MPTKYNDARTADSVKSVLRLLGFSQAASDNQLDSVRVAAVVRCDKTVSTLVRTSAISATIRVGRPPHSAEVEWSNLLDRGGHAALLASAAARGSPAAPNPDGRGELKGSSIMLSARCTSMPFTCAQSMPAMRYNSVRRSKRRALRPLFLPFGFGPSGCVSRSTLEPNDSRCRRNSRSQPRIFS